MMAARAEHSAENVSFGSPESAAGRPESWRLDRKNYADAPPAHWQQQRAEFKRELKTPEERTVPGGAYRLYHFNRDRYDPESNLVAFFHPLGSSPSTRHGRQMAWQLRQRFPDNLIVAIGSEGTPDARTQDGLDPDHLASLRKQFIDDTRQAYMSGENAPTDLIGQSFGGLLAHEVAEHMHGNGQPVEHLALLSASFKSTRTVQFLSRLARQEAQGAWRHRNTRELTQLGRYAVELTSRSARRFPLYYNLLRYITESEPDLDNVNPDTDIIVVGGEHDTIAYTGAEQAPDTRAPDLHITVARDAHSTFLIDSAFCGHVLETAIGRRPLRG